MLLVALETSQRTEDMDVPGVPVTPLEGPGEGSLVCLGQWQLAPDVRVPGRTGICAWLRGLSL